MKFKSLKFTRFILKCTCFAIGVFLFFTIPLPKNEVKTPNHPYKTYEEEYIAAIDNYIKTGEIIIPEDTTFSTDGETITIESNESNARVHCRFVIDNSIPVYSSYYSKWNEPLATLVVITVFAAPFLAYAILNELMTKVYTVYTSKKNRKTLCFNKSSATHGDNRGQNCKTCEKINTCKCITCINLGLCGNCPSSDCEDAFEEFLEDVKKRKSVTVLEEETIVNHDSTDTEEPIEHLKNIITNDK